MLPDTYKRIALDALERSPGDVQDDETKLIRIKDFKRVLSYLRGPRVDVDGYIMALEEELYIEVSGPFLVVHPLLKPKKKKEPKETKEA